MKGHNDHIYGLAWNPDGRTLASATTNTARFWDAATGQTLRELKGCCAPVAWSPDGRVLANGTKNFSVQLLDIPRGQNVVVMQGHTGPVIQVMRSKDRKYIVSTAAINIRDMGKETAKWDDERIVWDARTGERLKDAPMPVLAEDINSLKSDIFYIHRRLPNASLLSNRTISSNDDYICIPDGSNNNNLLRIPNILPSEEIARLKRLTAPKPDWHRGQTAECEKQTNWFAAAFHLRRLATLEPANAEVAAKLKAIEVKLTPRETAPPPRRK